MGSISEGIKTFNATLRTLILAGLLVAVAAALFYAYSEYTRHDRLVKKQRDQLTALETEVQSKQAAIEQLTAEVEDREQQIEKLATALTLLKTDQRLARLDVISIDRAEDGNVRSSQLEFVELSPQGNPLSAPKRFTLPGDVIYIDNWIIKFEDEYIERGDIERGTSLCLFRRIFSEDQVPSEGVPLDEVGMRPQAYARGSRVSEFEERLWSEFWEFANDPRKAAEMGIRAAHGEAVSIKVREGMSYHIELRASGGLTVQPAVQSQKDRSSG